uniref:Alpha-galactosidase n=1 Tax=Trichobilharzia regenti TaxID=157069 RepID=A0AA85IZC3_TRIRE|nr:unnamed protein product [Trichobilharzia regenti]
MTSVKMFMLYFQIIISITGTWTLDNGMARTPPMGWMSWQRFRCQIDCQEYPNDCISEKLIQRTADKLASDGWSQLGYRYLIIDDCWQSKERDPKSNQIVADQKRFPNGIKSLSEYIHSKNLLFGIYLDYGTLTCQEYPGSMHYLEVDAKSLVDWNTDYVKMDGCYSPPEAMPDGYEKFSKLMNSTGRRMVFSCSYPAYIEWIQNPKLIDWKRLQKNCNLWRMLGDVQDSWSSVVNIINAYVISNKILPSIAGPGHWNDPDMLLLGNFGLSNDQKRVQMGMWCMFAAPLLISADMDQLDDVSVALLTNANLLAIDQDKGGHQAEFIKSDRNVQYWIRQLDSDPVGWAIACLNLDDGGGPIHLHVNLDEFKSTLYKILGDKFQLVDVFTGKKVGVVKRTENFTIIVNPSGIMMYRVTPISSAL